ncbi:SCO3242 family prenyltransferase [Streptomyces hygroscopicus]|uniref:SCO3242 family prenyltransferase n=1 Tax=Streptomyces hygroscopicus TaxID=1912 RepID=UPI00362722D4
MTRAAGERGNHRGDWGNQGDCGNRGDYGRQGDYGHRGDYGRQGDYGHRGDYGRQGDSGNEGDCGRQGGSGNRGGWGSRGDWAELLRISALFTVPGDALAGAAAVGRGPNRGTALAVCASLCLYEAGMALNDWADRDIDAVERPGRPLPSGRIAPAAALAAATGLTAAGLACAAAAGRPALATATALAGTVWAYDLGLKNTLAGPPTMAATRALDLLLGAAATTPVTPRPAAVGSAGGAPRLAAVRTTPAALRPAAVASAPVTPRTAGVRSALRPALRPAVLLGAHTLAVTAVSRREAVGGSSAAPLAALAVGTAIAWTATRRPSRPANPAARRPALDVGAGHRTRPVSRVAAVAGAVLAGGYAATIARPLAHAALNPSPYLLQRAVGSGIRAVIPLQAVLASRAGAHRTAAGLLALMPVARRLSRKVSAT